MALAIMTDPEYVFEETSLVYMTDSKPVITRIFKTSCFISGTGLSSLLQMIRSLS